MRPIFLAALLALAGCEHRAAPSAAPLAAAPAVTAVSAPPVVKGPARPLGDPPRAVAEPAVQDHSTPGALLLALAAAIEKGDAAALARLRASKTEKPVLDAHDVARARLDFLSHGLERHWQRVLAAVKPESLTGDERVLAVADLGGALGAVTLRLERTADGWVLR